MTISTIDQALAGMQPPRLISKALTGTMVAGRPWSTWALGGSPGAGSFDNTLNGVALSSSSSNVNGQIPHTDPVSGNAHLARLVATASQAGLLLLADRIWHNGGIGITTTTPQSITSPSFPARDANGSSNGDGILCGCEVSAAVGAGTPTLTLGYTNEGNTSGRTATNAIATAASAAAGSFFPFGLQAGDKGIRSIQSLTLSATWTSGTINLVAYRILAALSLPGAMIPNELDIASGGFPRLYNGAVPFLIFIPNTTTTSNIVGLYQETQG